MTSLRVNGAEHQLEVEPRRTLLDALRIDLGLTGAKKACDMGNCGACTVHLDGAAVYSCLVLAADCAERSVTTIEGLAPEGRLHALQEAFIAADAFQCGFCTPGQIMSAVGLLREGHAVKDDEVREQMSGNLCRCGAYVNIVSAVHAAGGAS
jgi:xanthine dehydrogenase YagT iron-sulfur-binding subunit